MPDASRPSVRIGDRPIGHERPTYLIAEVGSNHDGSLDRALELVRAAAEAGADAVKFQSFTADGITRTREPAFPILERLAVPDPWHAPLFEEARARGIDFLSTPFDEGRADLLARIGVPAFKIASGDLTHHALLAHVASLGRPVLLSTGLADQREIERAVAVLEDAGCRQLVLLHCVAAYPPCWEDLNLRAVRTLDREFAWPVGLSDHSPGHDAVVAALALGACVVEKHVTYDRQATGPDHAYALTFDEFASMVAAVRHTEQALGDGRLAPADCEKDGRRLGRRSVHAACDLAAGVELRPSMWKIVRPAEGVAADEAPELVGRRLRRPVGSDEPISWDDVA
ncbi:MAG: N-acetylneuraminate synthase family protein [Myxococcota bacterium]